MNTITSFMIDHDKLTPGIYLSRADDEILTYDMRFVKPNIPPFMENAPMHTFEHLFATIARNSEFADNVVYFGPMGCRTGFYFLTRSLSRRNAVELIKSTVRLICEWNGDIPGATKPECGNYLEHDLEGAKILAENYYRVITDWTPDKLVYPQ